MNLDTKLILDKISEHDAKWEKLFKEQDVKWDKRFMEAASDQEKCVPDLEKVVSSLDEWRPEINSTIDDIRLKVRKLNKYWEQALLEPVPQVPCSPRRPSWLPATQLPEI